MFRGLEGEREMRRRLAMTGCDDVMGDDWISRSSSNEAMRLFEVSVWDEGSPLTGTREDMEIVRR